MAVEEAAGFFINYEAKNLFI